MAWNMASTSHYDCTYDDGHLLKAAGLIAASAAVETVVDLEKAF